MSSYTIIITDPAQKDIRRLDRHVQERVKTAILIPWSKSLIYFKSVWTNWRDAPISSTPVSAIRSWSASTGKPKPFPMKTSRH